jgi:hypothetical protein
VLAAHAMLLQVYVTNHVRSMQLSTEKNEWPSKVVLTDRSLLPKCQTAQLGLRLNNCKHQMPLVGSRKNYRVAAGIHYLTCSFSPFVPRCPVEHSPAVVNSSKLRNHTTGRCTPRVALGVHANIVTAEIPPERQRTAELQAAPKSENTFQSSWMPFLSC